LVLEQQVLGPVAFGIGAVSLGAATYLFLFHRASGATASGARAPIRWDLGAAPGLAFGQVAVQF
jgi:hypothetical protein